MPDYTNGKIYKIYNTFTNDIYIGSTTQLLCQRMRKHRHNSKYDNYQTIKLYKCFHEYGIDNFYIELIENYNCDSKEQLTAREGYHIRKLQPSLNTVIIGRTNEEYKNDNSETIKIQQQQYRKDNKETIAEKSRKYREMNKEQLKIRKQQYRDGHKEHIQQYSKTYYENNKDKIKDYVNKYRIENAELVKKNKQEQIVCEICGSTLRKDCLNRHKKSKRCQQHNLNIKIK